MSWNRLPWDGSGGVKLDALHEELALFGQLVSSSPGHFAPLSSSGGPPIDSTPHVPLRAERIKFGVTSEFFDPIPHLDYFTAATFLEPEILYWQLNPETRG